MGSIVWIHHVSTKEDINNMVQDLEKVRDLRTYEEMPEAAEILLTMFPQEGYPVPIIGIAKKMGFKVYEMDLEDEHLSGLIAISDKYEKKFGSNKVIMVNMNDSSGHKRFTIAHELAHYLFDAQNVHEYYNTYQTNEGQRVLEKENRECVANYFAANIMMPSLDFRKKYYEYTEMGMPQNQITEKMAGYFGVPKTAVRIRYQELGMELSN